MREKRAGRFIASLIAGTMTETSHARARRIGEGWKVGRSARRGMICMAVPQCEVTGPSASNAFKVPVTDASSRGAGDLRTVTCVRIAERRVARFGGASRHGE